MTLIAIRADASQRIGGGHIYRCRTLARELRRRGANIIFICRSQTGDLIHILRPEFQVLVLPKHPSPDDSSYIASYQDVRLNDAYLYQYQIQDAFDTVQALNESAYQQLRWLVVDHYCLDSVWEKEVLSALSHNNKPRLFAIDDLARSHHVDLLLDQNYYAASTQTRYKGLVPTGTKLLLGPHYALLGPEYAYLQKSIPDRRELHRLLISFGSVDSKNLTSRTLLSLRDPDLSSIKVDVVLGPKSPHLNQVSQLVSERSNTTLHVSLPSLAGIILRSDLTIGAGGSTSWERASLDIPSIVIATASNQIPLCSALSESGYINYLGTDSSVTVDCIRKAILDHSNSTLTYKHGPELTDGWGSSRVASCLLGPETKLFFSLASKTDIYCLYRWANDKSVRQNSYSPTPISLQGHSQWFHEHFSSTNCLIFIANDRHGCPIGQVRFDRTQSHCLDGSSIVFIDYSIDTSVRGFGLAANLLRNSVQACHDSWGANLTILADAKNANVPSCSALSSAGFIVDHSPTDLPVPPGSTRWRFPK